jgi:hypothetical protein
MSDTVHTPAPSPATDTSSIPVDERPVEVQISSDMVKKGLMAGPALVALCGLVWGFDGLASSAFGVGLVLVNFTGAALLVSGAAKISTTLVMAAAMSGYLVRLGFIMVAVLLVRDETWISLPALGATIIVTHLGLLIWELRYVAISLAFAGVKPAKP